MKQPRTRIPISELDPRQALYELLAYQEDLEIQNKELQEAREQNEILIEKYTTLYDHAPSGYLTLDRSGKILELNLYAATFLYKNRSQLIGSNFQELLSFDSQPVFEDFFHKIFRYKDNASCEVSLSIFKDTPIFVQIEGITSESRENCLVTMVNITALKQTEEALMKSRKEFQDYFENGSVGMSVSSPGRGWLELNQRFCQMLGYTKNELLGINWMDLSHPDDLQANLYLYQQALDGKLDKYQMDKRFIRKDRSILYVTLSVVCQRNEDGTIHHLLSSYVDITERELAEKALKESEERFKALFDNSPDAIILTDIETGLIIDVNQATCDLLARSIEEIRGMFHSKVHPPREEELSKIGYQQHNKNLNLSGQAQPIELSVLRSDGVEVPVEIVANLINLNGKPTMQGLFRDITKRKKAEEELRESEKRYRLIAENSGDVIWILNVETMHFSYVSPSVKRLRGYTPEEVMEQEFSAVVTQDSLDYLLYNLPDRIEEYHKGLREIYTDEISQPCKDGSIVITEVVTRFMTDEENGQLIVVGVTRDISRRKHFEEKLRESEMRFRTIAEKLPVLISLSRIEDSSIIFTNSAYNEAFGFKAGETIGLKGLDFYYDQHDRKRMIDLIKDQGFVQNHQLKARKSDGTPLWLLSSAQQIIFEGYPTLLGAAIDNTKSKNIEEDLKQKVDELERLNQMNIDREQKLNGLQEEVNLLLTRLGEKKKY